MKNPVEPQTQPSSSATERWIRRPFQAPTGAHWVPAAFVKLTGLPALPAMRALRPEADGSWSAEEYQPPSQIPLGEFLTQSAAPVWVFVSIVQQCLAGLVSLHQQGLRHGAISPQTLLVNASGHVVLAGCGGGPPWENAAIAAREGGAPPLPTELATDDLRCLGLTFRSVLGGDAMQRLTATRTDIAPLVAEWIDWLADPEEGHEPTGAVQAAAIFSEIRTGRPGYRPWKHNVQLPAQVGAGSSTASAESEAERQKRLREAANSHGSGIEWSPMLVAAVITILLLAGGSWFLVRFLKKEKPEGTAQAPPAIIMGTTGKIPEMLLPDEAYGVFAMSGGDIEPLPGSEALIIQLMETLSKLPPPPQSKEMESEEELRKTEAELLAKGEKLPPRAESDYLCAPEVFPALGAATAGRTEGDYYLVWRTQNFLLTDAECREVQSAILRTARYCGVRVMAWVVLPNHAGVVLRVPQRKVIPDESLERRIAILRGEKTSSGVMSQLNGRLKAGDNAGADQIRRTWIASMGTAAGFFSVLRTVPVVSSDLLAGRPLWREKPLRFAQLRPGTADLLQAATVLDTAAVKGKIVAAASEWPLCGLKAAMINYGPALRAVSVLMQKDPQADPPVPQKEELLAALGTYRRHLGDLPVAPAMPASSLKDPALAVKPLKPGDAVAAQPSPATPTAPVATQPVAGGQQ